MPRTELYLPRYVEVLSAFMLAGDEMVREVALAEATEVGKAMLVEGDSVDLMFELHRRAQRLLADRWSGSDAEPAEQAARERLVEGEAIPLMLSLMLPHELAQRAHHERRWRRDNAKLMAVFDQTESLMVIYDSEGQIDDVNPAFIRATGWSARQAASGQIGVWSTPLPLDGTENCRAEQQRGDGSRYLAEWSVSPIFGHDGMLINHVCIGRDVTRQQQIDDGLRENDKLRAVATLAAGIAHDFNNLLGSIVGLAEVCQAEAGAGTRLARNLGRIREAGDKAAALVRQMLDFSRQSPRATQRLRLSELLQHADGLLRAALPSSVQMSLRIHGDGEVRVDIVQMEQVLLNITRNAAQAMAGRGGTLDLVVDRAEPADAVASRGYLRLSVSDSGVGMSPEVMSKIFDPFFTTKPVGQGTGLGLSAVYGIVSSHDGTIEVRSQPGHGTTFSIFLPLAADESPQDAPSS